MQSISTFKLFRNSVFRNLWSSTLISNLGGLIQAVGAGWLMALISSSHSMVGLVQSATTLPLVMFSLMAGALADNFNRRQIMLYAQIMMMIISMILAILSSMSFLTPWLLLCFTFLIGCGTAFYNPSWQATIGDIVSRENIPAAVSLNSVGFNLMRSVGPAIGGAIIATLGVAAAFLFNAISYIPLIGTLFFWKPIYENNMLPRERLLELSQMVYVMLQCHLIFSVLWSGRFCLVLERFRFWHFCQLLCIKFLGKRISLWDITWLFWSWSYDSWYY